MLAAGASRDSDAGSSGGDGDAGDAPAGPGPMSSRGPERAPAALEFSGTYPAVATSVKAARSALVQFARKVGAADAVVEAVELAASEAVTNIVQHAYRGGQGRGEIDVSAAVAAGELWVLVSDSGSGLQPRHDSPGLGLGLGLIAQVSDCVDILHRSGGGLELRMRFALAPAASTESAA
jgi:serine/threonine-protein kinase RsbW